MNTVINSVALLLLAILCGSVFIAGIVVWIWGAVNKLIKGVVMEDKRNWHLEKSISIGHILTTVVVAGSLVTWLMHQESRVAVLESENIHNLRFHTTMETHLQNSLDKFDAALIRIETKLDTKADKK